MNVPDVIVEWTLGVVATIGGAGFIFLRGKSMKNETNIKELEEKMDQKLLDAIEKFGSKMTPIVHCEAKQQLWQERFDSMMVQNKDQHDHISSSVGVSLESISEKLEVVFDKFDTMQECLTKIQLNKEC